MNFIKMLIISLILAAESKVSSFLIPTLKKYIKQGQGQMSYFSPQVLFASHSSLTLRLCSRGGKRRCWGRSRARTSLLKTAWIQGGVEKKGGPFLLVQSVCQTGLPQNQTVSVSDEQGNHVCVCVCSTPSPSCVTREKSNPTLLKSTSFLPHLDAASLDTKPERREQKPANTGCFSSRDELNQ